MARAAASSSINRGSLLYYAAIPAAVVGFIVLSFLPPEIKNLYRSTNPQTAGMVHILYHLLAFGTLAAGLMSLSQGRRQRLGLLSGAVAFGIGLEIAQHVMSGAPLEWWDMRDDAIGVALGAALYWKLAAHRRTAMVRPAVHPALVIDSDMANLAFALASFEDADRPVVTHAPAPVSTASTHSSTLQKVV